MIQTIGILSPGDMGAAIGQALAGQGLRVVAALDARSARTRRLAAEAGLEDVGSVERMVEASDAVLSVLVPAQAVAAAERVAAALRSVGTSLLYADLNAVAPATTRRIGEIVEAAGARYVDGGIIGPPPRDRATRIHLSGPHARELAALADQVLEFVVVGPQIGQASGLKMCYAALTKGLTALGTELMVTAHQLGLHEPLRAELEHSQQALLSWLTRSIPGMPPKAHRWVGEMEEIAATFEGIGLTPRTLLGAADMYRWVATTPLGQEAPERRDQSRGLDETVVALAEDVPAGATDHARRQTATPAS
ncbi:MAG: NAD(P)-dependent oxidoreductase [Chloroflexi bacterium]|nr:NAD(P)-dependent oxidoreductase [Chloroflexota bacterium]